PEQADVLERPCDPDADHLMRLVAGDVGAIERDPPFRRDIQAGDHVEERRLTCAVRSDEAHDGSARDREIDVADRDQAAEAFRAAGCDEEVSRGFGGRSRHRGHVPASGPVVVEGGSGGGAFVSAIGASSKLTSSISPSAVSSSPVAPVTSAAIPTPCISALAPASGKSPSGRLIIMITRTIPKRR